MREASRSPSLTHSPVILLVVPDPGVTEIKNGLPGGLRGAHSHLSTGARPQLRATDHKGEKSAALRIPGVSCRPSKRCDHKSAGQGRFLRPRGHLEDEDEQGAGALATRPFGRAEAVRHHFRPLRNRRLPGRAPTRSELVAARRAARRLAETGQARAVYGWGADTVSAPDQSPVCSLTVHIGGVLDDAVPGADHHDVPALPARPGAQRHRVPLRIWAVRVVGRGACLGEPPVAEPRRQVRPGAQPTVRTGPDHRFRHRSRSVSTPESSQATPSSARYRPTIRPAPAPCR